MTPYEENKRHWPGLAAAALITALIFWVFARVPADGPPAPPALAIRDVRIYDPAGQTLLHRRTLLLKNGKVLRVQPLDLPVPEDYRLVQGRGAVAAPALIDAGVYLSLEGRLPAHARSARPEDALRRQRRAGVAAVLDLNSSRTMERAWRKNRLAAALPLARFAGPLYSGYDSWVPPGRTPWETNRVILTSPVEVDQAWREHLGFQDDLTFAVLDQPSQGGLALSSELLRRLGARSRHDKIPFLVRATSAARMARALDARPDLLMGSPTNEALGKALLESMLEAGVAWAPMLGETLALWPKRPLKKELARYSALGEFADEVKNSLDDQRELARHIRPHELGGARRELMLENVAQARAMGVTLVAASGAGLAGMPHGLALHREMDFLMEAGLSPSEAWRAATFSAARAGGLKEHGRIQAGWPADLLLLETEPFGDRDGHLKLRAIISKGELIEPGTGS